MATVGEIGLMLSANYDALGRTRSYYRAAFCVSGTQIWRMQKMRKSQGSDGREVIRKRLRPEVSAYAQMQIDDGEAV